MKKNLTRLLIFFGCIAILNACSSDQNGFRDVEWGATIDEVVEKEASRGNDDYEEEVDDISDEENTELRFKDIVVSGQKTDDLKYEFSYEFNGETYEEQVLVEGTYFFDPEDLDEDKLIKDLKSKYGKGQEKVNYMDDPYYEWKSGDTLIRYWPDPFIPFLSYDPISEDSHPEKDSNENGEDAGL